MFNEFFKSAIFVKIKRVKRGLRLKKAISASNADASKRKKEAEDWQGKYKATLDEQAKAKLEKEAEGKDEK